MGTNIRADISKRNRWWISKHRYYELKHFCLQYREFKQLYLSSIDVRAGSEKRDVEWSDPVGAAAIAREEYKRKMDLIEKCCYEASDEIGSYIFKAVTEGISYVGLKMMHNIPCGKEMFYDRYRKFFYILSKM